MLVDEALEAALHPQEPVGWEVEETEGEEEDLGEQAVLVAVLHPLVGASDFVFSVSLQQVGEVVDQVEEVRLGPVLPCRRVPREQVLLERWRPSRWVGQAQRS